MLFAPYGTNVNKSDPIEDLITEIQRCKISEDPPQNNDTPVSHTDCWTASLNSHIISATKYSIREQTRFNDILETFFLPYIEATLKIFKENNNDEIYMESSQIYKDYCKLLENHDVKGNSSTNSFMEKILKIMDRLTKLHKNSVLQCNMCLDKIKFLEKPVESTTPLQLPTPKSNFSYFVNKGSNNCTTPKLNELRRQHTHLEGAVLRETPVGRGPMKYAEFTPIGYQELLSLDHSFNISNHLCECNNNNQYSFEIWDQDQSPLSKREHSQLHSHSQTKDAKSLSSSSVYLEAQKQLDCAE